MPRPKPIRPRPQVIPREYAGRWVAWSPDGLRIVAVGDSFDQVEQTAAEQGFPEVAIARVPIYRRRMGSEE